MDKYLANLLPRLQKYGQKLNKVEQFVDKVWALYDDGVFATYRFRRNQTLLITVNGDVEESTWEYLHPDSVYVKRAGKGYMFRHGFVMDGLLIMQKEGNAAAPAIFYNEQVIPDGDIGRYLIHLMETKHGMKRIGQNNEYVYFDKAGAGLTYQSEVYSSSLEPLDDAILTFGNTNYQIENGRVTSIHYVEQFRTKQGPVTIHMVNPSMVQEGNLVYMQDGSPGHGEMTVSGSGSYKITVENGKVTKVSQHQTGLLIVAVILIAVVILFFYLGQPKTITQAAVANNTPADPTPISSIVDTSAVVTPAPPTIPTDINGAKNTLINYYKHISLRKFDEVRRLFAPTVSDYYGQKELSQDGATSIVQEFWSGQTADANVEAFENTVTVQPHIGGYTVKAEVVESSSKTIYKVPHMFVSNVEVELDEYLKITKLTGKITDSRPDIYRMFDIPVTATPEDIGARNRKDDFEKVFKTIYDAALNSPTEAKLYKDGAMFLYPNCEVELSNTGQLLPLSDFLDIIINNNKKISFVADVTTDPSGLKHVRVY